MVVRKKFILLPTTVRTYANEVFIVMGACRFWFSGFK